MKVKARKVGNSIIVTIPKDVAAQLGINKGTEMDVYVRDNAVVMKPVKSRWTSWSVKQGGGRKMGPHQGQR